VLVDAGAEDPLRVLPDGKVTHASELARKGRRCPLSRPQTLSARATYRRVSSI
jgi:hypothetical protein